MWQDGTFDYCVLQEGSINQQSYDQWVQQECSSRFNDPFYDWKCQGCGTTDASALVEGSVWFVCNLCGVCQVGLGVHLVDALPSQELPQDCSGYVQCKRDHEGKILKGRISYGMGSRRRYKREFYYRERLAQWTCREPPVKKQVLDKFQQILWSGYYGSQRFITKGTVLQMCKDNKLCKYKENWKSVLKFLKDGKDVYPQPDPALLDECAALFKLISKRFDKMSKVVLGNFLKGSKGKSRHHILHVNYLHRKILEILGIYDYHREFPLLRTPAKIHALDDVMQQICQDLQLPFKRTAVILPPKCKNRFKKKPVNFFLLHYT